LRCLRGRSDGELKSVAASMSMAGAAFGQPHLHAGRGIRQVKPGVYETRVGLSLRLVFFRDDEALVFDFAGNHDEVRAYLRKI
jgi:hypothetical protein